MLMPTHPTCKGPSRQGALGVNGSGHGLLMEVVCKGSKVVSKAGRCVVVLEDVCEAIGVKCGFVDTGVGGQQGALFDGLSTLWEWVVRFCLGMIAPAWAWGWVWGRWMIRSCYLRQTPK